MANVLTATNCIADVYDPLNLEGVRSFQYTDQEDYNCMGFAFQTFSWMHPRVDASFIEYLDEERSCDHVDEKYEDDDDDLEFYTEDEISSIESEAIQDLIDYNRELREFPNEDVLLYEVFDWHYGYCSKVSLAACVGNILNNFSNVRQIKSFDELGEGEYGVAFACRDSDFHFGVYVPTLKTYCHKMGWSRAQTASGLDEIFSSGYDSERFYFAVKGDFEDIYLDILEEEMDCA